MNIKEYLKDIKADKIKLDFYGSGDSGGIEHVTFYEKKDDKYNIKIAQYEQDDLDELINSFEQVFEDCDFSFNDSGASGQIEAISSEQGDWGIDVSYTEYYEDQYTENLSLNEKESKETKEIIDFIKKEFPKASAVNITYSGSGDSGGIDLVEITDSSNAILKPNNKDDIEGKAYNIIKRYHGGFEINEGGEGEININIQKGTVEFEKTDYLEEESTTKHQIIDSDSDLSKRIFLSEMQKDSTINRGFSL